MISLLVLFGNIQPIYAKGDNEPKVKVVWTKYYDGYWFYGYTIKNPSSTDVLTDVKVHVTLSDSDTTYIDYTVTISELMPGEVYRYADHIESKKKASLKVEYESCSKRTKKKSDTLVDDVVTISNLYEGLNTNVDEHTNLFRLSGDVALDASHTEDEDVRATFIFKKDGKIVLMDTVDLDKVEPGTSEAFVKSFLVATTFSSFEYDSIGVYPQFQSATSVHLTAIKEYEETEKS